MEDWVEEKTRQEVLKKRKHKLALAETGAMLRMVRSILTIKPTYTTEELRKPFVVAKIVFSPNLGDPQIRAAILASSLRALEGAYGTVPSTVHALELNGARGHTEDEALQDFEGEPVANSLAQTETADERERQPIDRVTPAALAAQDQERRH